MARDAVNRMSHPPGTAAAKRRFAEKTGSPSKEA
jgi:hypothetical protein